MPYKPMVAPWVTAMSKMAGHFPPKEPFDKAEYDGGVQAFAALMYQESVRMNAWALVGMWGLGIGSYRIIKYLDEKAKNDEKGKATLTHQEMAAKLKSERDRANTPTPTVENSAARPANGVAPDTRAQTPSGGEKPTITAEQAAALINFPGENN